MSMKAMNRTIAAGWMAGTCPVSRKYFVFIRPAIGNQPSAPAGTRYIETLATTFAVPNPEKKLDPQPSVQDDEQPLDDSPHLLRTIWTEPPDQLLPLHLSLNRYCCHSFHFEMPFG
jgi:hypothetical protein